jgi:hypothetical protein
MLKLTFLVEKADQMLGYRCTCACPYIPRNPYPRLYLVAKLDVFTQPVPALQFGFPRVTNLAKQAER